MKQGCEVDNEKVIKEGKEKDKDQHNMIKVSKFASTDIVKKQKKQK